MKLYILLCACFICWTSTMVVRLTCNQEVLGSSPRFSSRHLLQMPMAAHACKSEVRKCCGEHTLTNLCGWVISSEWNIKTVSSTSEWGQRERLHSFPFYLGIREEISIKSSLVGSQPAEWRNRPRDRMRKDYQVYFIIRLREPLSQT